MKPLVNVLPVEPIGKRKSWAFVTLEGGRRGGMREVELSVYSPSPRGEELRQARAGAGRRGGGLVKCSRALGITAEQLSGLESGRYTLSDADWEVALRVAREKAGEP